MPELIRVSRATDFEEIAAFQRGAFADEWLKSERRRLQCAEYYRWKYLPPAGPAWLVLERSWQGLGAMLAAVPFRLAGESGSTAWQICDIATNPRLRRRGLFAHCLGALAGAVPSDITFCFPNQQSRAGLVKAGYAISTTLRLHAHPILTFPMRRPASPKPDAGDMVDCYFAFQSDPRCHGAIQRSPEFLHWRYAAHPLNRYVTVKTPRSGPAEAVAVVRHLFGGRVGLVLEIWAGSEEALRVGRDAARHWAKASGSFALLRAQELHAVANLPNGALRRWRRPWDIVCYARKGLPQGKAEGLHLKLGDWDAL